jgi:hypothetical protein
MLRWNEVTWYSKLGAAIVIFGALPALSFYIGVQYDQVMNLRESVSNVAPVQTRYIHKVNSSTITPAVQTSPSLPPLPYTPPYCPPRGTLGKVPPETLMNSQELACYADQTKCNYHEDDFIKVLKSNGVDNPVLTQIKQSNIYGCGPGWEWRYEYTANENCSHGEGYGRTVNIAITMDPLTGQPGYQKGCNFENLLI